MYVSPNFKTKKALKEALEAGEVVTCFNPGPFGKISTGFYSLEGPHYPKPHKWYARAWVEDGRVLSIK